MTCGRLLLVAAGIAVPVWLAPGDTAAETSAPLAAVVTVGGHVEIFHGGTGPWTDASLREEVSDGDGVRTRAGRLTLRVSSAEALRLGPRTQLVLSAADGSGDGRALRVRLEVGRLWLAVRSTGPGSRSIDVDAGEVSVTTEGGGVAIELGADGSARIGVAHGTATVRGRGWTRALPQDQELVVSAAGAVERSGAVKRGARDAEWIAWNERQDLAGGYGARRAE